MSKHNDSVQFTDKKFNKNTVTLTFLSHLNKELAIKR